MSGHKGDRMTRTRSAAAVLLLAMAASAQPVVDGFDWVTVGDPGNPAFELPPSTMPQGFYTRGRGSVDYAFKITRSEISLGEYFEFFSTFSTVSAALDEALHPASGALRINPYYAGPGNQYHLNPSDPHAVSRPISVSRNAAMMYANWLHNGKSSDPTDLLDGAYDFNSAPGGVPITHEPDARYRLPTLDEHMKAAYYDPDKNGNGPGWWRYSNQSDEPSAPGTPDVGAHPYGLSDAELEAIYGAGETNPSQLPLGVYDGPQSQSHYGLIDLLTGRSEVMSELEYVLGEEYWLQTVVFRNAWGWQSPLDGQGITGSPNSDTPFYGFRLVVVPSPGGGAIAVLGSATFLGRRRRS